MPNESGIKHFILATAGHVDHGKTALVQALTGIDTDRLPEEKARGITIELGFAHLELPGFSVGVIDVPGHEDFVRNMIAGVGAIDLALLVVAADDGWMPQTEEHLQILTYLGLKRAVIALTKVDLGGVDSRVAEIQRQLQNSPFATAPIVATSVQQNIGMSELRSALTQEFARLPPPRDSGKPRLFVDRVFTMRGSGTVVTGSLSGGTFSRGENVLVQPQNVVARIRALQSHSRPLELAGPRRRLALNLADLRAEQIARGSIVGTTRNAAACARVIDVLLSRSSRLPPGTRALCNGAVLNFHFGSMRSSARVQLQSRDELLPNESMIARLRLRDPVCVFENDRFILRDASEWLTIAGGVVLDASAEAMKFRSSKHRALLEQRAVAPDDIIVLLRTKLERDQFAFRSELLPNAPFSVDDIASALQQLQRSSRIFLDEKIAADADWWKSLRKSAAGLINAEHTQHSERPGLDLNRLRDTLGLHPDVFAALVAALAHDGFKQHGSALRRADFRPSLPAHLCHAGARIRAQLQARPFDPPSRRDLERDLAGQQALRFLSENGEVIALSEDLVLGAEAVDQLKEAVARRLHGGKSATVSELRQATGSTRRIMVPILEYFDRLGLTRRSGDRRALRQPPVSNPPMRPEGN